MKISDYLKESFCVMELAAKDKEGTIREIAKELSAKKAILQEEKFIEDVLERESLGSTGIGHRVAIPHARTQSVRGFIVGFGKSEEGVDFNAIDGEKVQLIFLMGAHPTELNLYLRLLAELSKLLMNNTFREELIAAQAPKDVISIIKKYETA